MKTYLDMWTQVKTLDWVETETMIELLSPASGKTVEINGVKCCDVDLLEALRHWLRDLVS